METTRVHVTPAQTEYMTEYLRDRPELSKCIQTYDRPDLEAQWQELTSRLNTMDGAVKSVEKWKRTWRNLKFNTKKRAIKQKLLNSCDTNEQGAESTTECAQNDEEYFPPKKRFGSFDEEIIKIEKEKLEIDKEYKEQKIQVLSRIASALEELCNKKMSQEETKRTDLQNNLL